MITKLSKDLRQAFPEMKGFSLSQPPLYEGVCLAYPDEQIVQAVLGQITWYHNIALLDKLKSLEERLWYALPNRRTRLYAVMFSFTKLKRVYTVAAGAALTNFDRTLPKPQSDLAQQLLKDPYNFDFLSLGEEAQERDARTCFGQPHPRLFA